MRGLFFKIFAIFWIAQSLIFIISTVLIVRHHFPNPGTIFDALKITLQSDATDALSAYQSGGCSAFLSGAARHEPAQTGLFTQAGDSLCATHGAPSSASGSDLQRMRGQQIGQFYVWTVPVTDPSGKIYQYLWAQPHAVDDTAWYADLPHFAFPQLPVAIGIGGITTFALVLLFTRPLVRLRKAARELAQGNLHARVEESRASSSKSQTDAFHGLVHDFNHMAERLESLVSAQQLLLRDVSHELRSPLARLSVALELAHEDAAPELDEHLDRIEREAEKLNQLIGQLLTLSSLETMENTSSFAPVSLNQICEQILPDAEYEARQRRCSVVLQQDAECIIQGDSELIYRAIENIVRNAIRYTAPATEVNIHIYRLQEASAQFAILEVTDHGPGIPESELSAIFRPFYRVDLARSSSTGGFGVGLAITERSVRLHTGTIQAINLSSGGLSIRMAFPLA